MIGYYAHHHGSGHVTRAASIAAELEESMTVLSSRPRSSEHAHLDWLTLPLDVDSTTVGDRASDLDPTASGVVHWAPIGVRGLTERMAMIAEWVARTHPRLVVVDVSVEIAMFVRLLGIPVVVVAMPGDRTDEQHQLVYRMATAIIAPWSNNVYDPASLHAFSTKTSYVGSISRFAGRPRTPNTTTEPNVFVLGGAGGTSLTKKDIDEAAELNSEYTWTAAGLDAQSWIDDVWPHLCAASVVITHAGQNALADVASARVPAVVVPQDRPYGEQDATAGALARAGVAVVAPSWPSPDRWRPLLAEAGRLGSAGWHRVEASGAAHRAARLLSETAAV